MVFVCGRSKRATMFFLYMFGSFNISHCESLNTEDATRERHRPEAVHLPLIGAGSQFGTRADSRPGYRAHAHAPAHAHAHAHAHPPRARARAQRVGGNACPPPPPRHARTFPRRGPAKAGVKEHTRISATRERHRPEAVHLPLIGAGSQFGTRADSRPSYRAHAHAHAHAHAYAPAHAHAHAHPPRARARAH
jgi:hypothetical protein